ncbi:MAG: NAD(P)/FAD-dependent oxidoreductase [Deltaproteobacteria bacterium]|nr:NAD(P)/FAD-dependent oxidoreductase [Deltaproteobacteria bacterium]
MRPVPLRPVEGPARESPGKAPGPFDPGGGPPRPSRSDFDVVVVGGGPAGLSAAAFCGRKFLSTAVFEEECWGGILTRYCPDKRIDNYPGAPRGIHARDLADALFEEARVAHAELIGCGVEGITGNGEVHGKGFKVRGKVVILACGSSAAEARIPGEKGLADKGGGVHYHVPDPSRFRGMRVVVVGGGDTAVSHVQRLAGVAASVTLVHRRGALRAQHGFPEEMERMGNASILLGTSVETILGTHWVEGVRVKNVDSGHAFDIPADAVVVAAGRTPNTVLFRDLGLALDGKGQIVADVWQKTSLPRILAIGDVTSHLKMIVTAVAQAASAAHEAYAQVRSPYWR